MDFLILPTMVALFLSVVILFYLVDKKAVPCSEKQNQKLDQAGVLCNILLVILYLPLSLLGSFSGMVSDGYVYGTPAQSFLCDFIGILGPLSPIVYLGGLLLSFKLRNKWLSLQSFLWQFAGIVWLLIIFAMIAVLPVL